MPTTTQIPTLAAPRAAMGIAVPATPRNNRIILDAIRDAIRDTEADRHGCDHAEWARGNIVHTNPTETRFDKYADDTNEERSRRQFKGETRLQQLERRGEAVAHARSTAGMVQS